MSNQTGYLGSDSPDEYHYVTFSGLKIFTEYKINHQFLLKTHSLFLTKHNNSSIIKSLSIY